MHHNTYFIDSHCHLDFAAFDSDREDVIARANAIGVKHFVLLGVEAGQWQNVESLCVSYSQMSGSVGIHPFFLDRYRLLSAADQEKALELDLGKLAELACQSWVKAVGECGIDVVVAENFVQRVSNNPTNKKYVESDLQLQQQLFEEQIKIANDNQKPLIIHHRKSHHLILQSFKRVKPQYGGIIHAFSGSIQDANNYIQQGFYLGCGGTITYERANKTKRVFEQVDLNHIVLETDSPDMPICGEQGKRNEPKHIISIAEALAKIKGMELAEIAQATSKNAIRALNLSL